MYNRTKGDRFPQIAWMARFSVKERDGAAGGESSSRARKRTRAASNEAVMRKDRADEAGDGNDEVVSGKAAGTEEQADVANGADTTDGSISAILTDPDVLDCVICFETLKIPVFQCENGHIACSSCCTKIQNKCPSCAFPIGYNRCRAIEKVIESMKVLCRNSEYGCRERPSLSGRKDHEDKCVHKPYHCPIASCCFLGSCQQLWQHCSDTHSDCVKRFQYNRLFPFILDKDCRYVILMEEKQDAVFILKNIIEQHGCVNMIKVEYVCPIVPERVLSYDLVTRQDMNTLRLQSVMEKHSSDDFGKSFNFLPVPRGYFDSNRKLEMELCINLSNGK